MSRYRLPKALGGGEAARVPPGFRAVGFSEQDDDGGWLYLIPVAALTEVSPPIPPEPEPGAYLIGDVLAVRFPNHPGHTCWFYGTIGHGYDETDSWESVWGDLGGPGVTITRLVPAPPEVKLPWGVGDDRVNVGGPGAPGVHYAARWISADLAERKAYALLAAARAAREAS